MTTIAEWQLLRQDLKPYGVIVQFARGGIIVLLPNHPIRIVDHGGQEAEALYQELRMWLDIREEALS